MDHPRRRRKVRASSKARRRKTRPERTCAGPCSARLFLVADDIGIYGLVADTVLASMLSSKTQIALVAGGVAGTAEAISTMPFEVTKNRLQMGHGPKGILTSMADTVRIAGPQGLYYGLQPQLVQVAGKTAIRFAAFERFKSVLPAGWTFSAGTLAGLTEAIVWVAPTERLKMLRQAELSAGAGSAGTSSNVLRAAQLVIERDGVRGLWMGTGPTAARQALANGARFLMFEHFKSGLQPFLPAAALAAVAGGATGVASVVLTNPVDVIKTRVQATPLGASGEAPGVAAIVRHMLASEQGLVSAMSVGMGARSLKIGLGQAVIFGTYDVVVRRLRGDKESER